VFVQRIKRHDSLRSIGGLSRRLVWTARTCPSTLARPARVRNVAPFAFCPSSRKALYDPSAVRLFERRRLRVPEGCESDVGYIAGGRVCRGRAGFMCVCRGA